MIGSLTAAQIDCSQSGSAGWSVKAAVPESFRAGTRKKTKSIPREIVPRDAFHIYTFLSLFAEIIHHDKIQRTVIADLGQPGIERFQQFRIFQVL